MGSGSGVVVEFMWSAAAGRVGAGAPLLVVR